MYADHSNKLYLTDRWQIEDPITQLLFDGEVELLHLAVQRIVLLGLTELFHLDIEVVWTVEAGQVHEDGLGGGVGDGRLEEFSYWGCLSRSAVLKEVYIIEDFAIGIVRLILI